MEHGAKLNLSAATLALLFTSSTLFGAEGIRLTTDSAKVAGAIGAKVATVDDVSAVRVNPANLTLLDENQYQFNASIWYGETDFTNLQGGTESMLRPFKFGTSAYAGGPLSDRLAWGVGIYSPFGNDMKWKRNGNFQFEIPNNAQLATVVLSPTIAYELTDDLSVGVSLDIMWSRIALDQVYPVNGAVQSFRGDGFGFGGGLGISWKPTENQTLSLTGRLPIAVDYEGDYSISDVPFPGFTNRSNFESEVEIPAQVAVGYALDVNDRMTVGFDFEWLQNSTHDDVPLDIGTNQLLLGGPVAVPLNWEDSWSAGTGIHYEFSPLIDLRAGYKYSSSPIPDRTFNPLIPLNDRHMVSFGAGLKLDTGRIDVAYVGAFFEDRNVRNNVNPAFNGDYKMQWDTLVISLTRPF